MKIYQVRACATVNTKTKQRVKISGCHGTNEGTLKGLELREGLEVLVGSLDYVTELVKAGSMMAWKEKEYPKVF